MTKQTSSSPHIAVIGAGPSGLATCKTLLEQGLNVTCFEAGDKVGGQWVLNNSSGTSACYQSVVTNTHKGMLHFSDFEPDASYPDFPSHEQMAQHFERYAQSFDLHQAIRFNSRVIQARRLDNGCWQLQTDKDNGGTFDGLVVATGRYGKANWPQINGHFSGHLMHSQQYLNPDQPANCRDKNVLIIGLGNTACDIAVELAAKSMAKRVLLSARSGHHIIPKRINGQLPKVPHPSDPMLSVLRITPPALRRKLMRTAVPLAMRFLTKGLLKPQDVGLPTPKQPPNPRNVVANDNVLKLLQQGAIEARPEVKNWQGNTVRFIDGSSDDIDVVIAATGYDINLSFMQPSLQANVHNLQLYRGILHPQHHNLYFVGLTMGLCSLWPFAEQQAQWVAAHIYGRVQLPKQKTLQRLSRSSPELSLDLLNCQLASHELRRDRRR